ncbi:MAG: D-alanine--D-alanine ligase A [Coxiella sp. RIFCSPHIGHO2_12_FULL_42_15]|nr:MAG: D-alanine--D-alanine ligase A [Coxiella sp. RIFCSPHIGHO2_12_FULL_42_15]
MIKKKSIVVLCGGQSTEHEVSILSAKNVVAALSSKKYHVAVVYITHQGAWHYIDDILAYLSEGPESLLRQHRTCLVLCHLGAETPSLVAYENPRRSFTMDCVIPMLHGTHGEDGSVQGLLQLMNVAYVGANVLSSSMCMDKAVTKQMLHASGIPTTPWILLTADQIVEGAYEKIKEQLGTELFVKPVSLGSSVGISRVKNAAEFFQATKQAMRYDQYILVEQSIRGREIECAVLGNQDPVASLPSEIISHHDFYTYEAKYLDPKGATTVVPAEISPLAIDRIRQMAVDAFRVMRCRGLLRVDFFMVNEDVIMVNEVNTLPGFTNISLYPKMWQVSGISYAELLDQLIELALQQHRICHRLQRVYSDLKDQTPENHDHRLS